MKKSILALGAAAVVGGLGFAGTAQALSYFGPGSVGTTATKMTLNPGGIGSELFVPYYSAQGSNATLLNITNTDTVNGKIVKVRFRGATNSDDVMDFTLYLSPGDMWSANIGQDPDGYANLITKDNSCVAPSVEDGTLWHGDASGNRAVPFITSRLAPYLSVDQKKANTREGYIEILNMADVPPLYVAGATDLAGNALKGTNPLFTAIKHKNGVPPCTQAVIDTISNDTTEPGDVHKVEGFGVAAGTGQLMASWMILDIARMAQFSGVAMAIAADGGTNIVVNPQLEGFYNGNAVTTDPLLVVDAVSGVAIVTPQWFDFPDMSTPMTPTAFAPPPVVAPYVQFATPAAYQAVEISRQLSVTPNSVTNEYLNAPNEAIPENTDWVVSQPSRRYFAAVDYGLTSTGTTGPRIIYNVTDGIVPDNNPYIKAGALTPAGGVLTLMTKDSSGPVACLTGKFTAIFDREELTTSSRPVLSPTINQAAFYCGEVFTLTFGRSPLSAALTNLQTSGGSLEGWATLGLSGSGIAAPNHVGATLPIMGYAAINGFTGSAAVGGTWPHRWHLGGN